MSVESRFFGDFYALAMFDIFTRPTLRFYNL